jgi:uncharacterized membrane protein YkgB
MRDKWFGVLGSLGSTITFATTVTIIPFMPSGWDPSAGFPAMAGLVPFLMKGFVLLAVSIYLLKQDVVRLLEARPSACENERRLAAGLGATARDARPRRA